MIKVRSDFVLLEEKEKKKGTIILDDQAKQKYSDFVVVSVGSKVEDWVKGDIAVFDAKRLEEVTSLKDGEKSYWICPERAIIAAR